MNCKLPVMAIIGMLALSCSGIVRANEIINYLNDPPIQHSETPLKLKYKGINNLEELFEFQYGYVDKLYENSKLIGGHTQKIDKNIIRHVLIKKGDSRISIRFDITDILRKLRSQSKRNRAEIDQLEKDITIPPDAIQEGKKS